MVLIYYVEIKKKANWRDKKCYWRGLHQANIKVSIIAFNHSELYVLLFKKKYIFNKKEKFAS